MPENNLKCPECSGRLVATDDPIVIKLQAISAKENKGIGDDTPKNLFSGQTYSDTSASSTTVSGTKSKIVKGLELSGQSGPDYIVFKCENCGKKFQIPIER